MPLTAFQAELGRLLAANRSEDSYLAGGGAILAAPNSRRFSRDLDYFHDSAERVATAFSIPKAKTNNPTTPAFSIHCLKLRPFTD